MSVDLRCGDSFDLLDTLADNSVDTVILDPPAGISFMGKDWDSDRGGRDAWIAWLSAILAKCLRVAKPGSMMLCWALPRTSHWTGTAIENAGWEVRDVISHLFGSGFPKSLDISKALDKAAGAEREVIGEKPIAYADSDCWSIPNKNADLGNDKSMFGVGAVNAGGTRTITAPATPAAREWGGYGTALKPACEFWWLAMKPVDGTFAQNALKWGVAGLNVDAGRIAGEYKWRASDSNKFNSSSFKSGSFGDAPSTQGRFPSHVVLSHSPLCVKVGTKRVKGIRGGNSTNIGGFVTAHADESKRGVPCGYADADGMETVEAWDCDESCPVRLLDEQAGNVGGRWGKRNAKGDGWFSANGFGGERESAEKYIGDTGGASRFFYVAKASRRERDAGLEGMPLKPSQRLNAANKGHSLAGKVRSDGATQHVAISYGRNHHPTVKPLTLMEYLCNLTRTPTGGVVLDPFMGSGSTIVAAIRTGRSAIGFEAKSEYYEIAVARAKHAQQGQPTLL